ncbi:MAG: hypothetical protein KJ592_05065 [Nanoarchaeota archaeon]|nr:hypothetical protein [Nanoarchaeota archaeon]
MVNVTFAVTDEVHAKMKMMSDVRWSEVARRAIIERIEDLETMNKICSKSKLTKKDVDEISEKIKRSAAKKFNEYRR